ncbi:Nuclear pore complex protein NUP98A [Cyphellophora attinorum]|uniref:Nuclear pore complex protein NUP98A n=1 Tax=Cyphellophora attinorum TaxID=1664694 RepID=A0A0N1P1X3_9EURO|nr:Nuclear pore complex protein NUP98A [Phialophora attinorum]KPI44496.1 Nuclear pore complex protein NUP98A [Phialophora attinorum]
MPVPPKPAMKRPMGRVAPKQQKATPPAKQPKAAPVPEEQKEVLVPKPMIMFSSCPHKFEQPSGPAPHNPNTKFNEEEHVFNQPSLCWDCDVHVYNNRQELLMRTVQEFDSERDRNEYLLIHKARIQADLRLQRDTEILLSWGEYIQTWLNSTRVNNGQREILSIDLQRDMSGVSAKLVWKVEGADEVPPPPAPPKPVVKDISTITRDVPVDLDGNKARPKWIFSAYAPTKTAPASLMTDNEFSTEEIRLRYYLAASTGQGTSADQEAMQMFTKIEQDYQNILNNVSDVSKFMDEAEKKRPNRLDLSDVSIFDGRKSREEVTRTFGGSQGNSFGADPSPFSTGATNSTGGFGQNQNTNSNPFSKPATSTFGQPTGPSAFGQPSFGQSGFGGSNSAPSFGQAATPSFGQSSTPAFGATAFGKPSLGGNSAPSFGTPSFGSTGFGQAQAEKKNPFAASSASSGFGQSTSAFGQTAQATPAFGAPSQPTSGLGQAAQPTTAFGQPSQPVSGFGQAPQPTTAFGQPSQPTSGFGQASQTTPAFGQASQSDSIFGQKQQPPNPFGQNTQSANPFGQQGQPSNAFGKPAGFGQSSQPASPFGQPAKPSSGFGTAFGQPAQPAASPFGGTTASTGFGQGGSGFGASTTPGQTSSAKVTHEPPANPFGRPSSSSGPAGDATLDTLNPPNPLTGKPSAPLHVTQSLPPRPPQTDSSGRLSSYRGQRATYESQPDKSIDGKAVRQEPILAYTRPDTRQPEKIWHPKAGNDPALIALSAELKKFDIQAKEEDYTETVVDEYRHLYETGGFRDGKLPLVPPMRAWVAYDF